MKVMRERFLVFVGHVFQRVAHLMDDAALVFRLGIRGSDGFLDPAQPVRAQDQNVLYAAIFQLIQRGQPVFGAFVFPDMDGQHLTGDFAILQSAEEFCPSRPK